MKHKTERKATGRGPGRRSQDASPGSRDQLLLAARTEFAKHGFRGTTVRHIADAADVTPAMVHYHFGDKRGLYEAMLSDTVDPLLRRLEKLATDGGSGSLREALHDYMLLISGTPELPALLMRDVLAADGVMRAVFIRDVASRGAGAMRAILERDVAGGTLRADLDPRLALLSLISMAVFPFIARPVVQEVLGLAYDDAMIEQLAEHTARLFHAGDGREESIE